jgi:hypothetical protein
VVNEASHLVVAAHEENFQSLRVGAEQEAKFQPSPAFKDILPQAPDGDSGMEVRLAEAIWQDSQRLFCPGHIRVAQVLERGEKARVE